MIWQGFKESAKARFIDDVFDAKRQWCPCTFQHMETTLTLETLQHKSSSLSISMTKTHMSKNSHAPKKVMSHIKKSMPHQNVTTTKFYHNQIFWHVHTQLPNFSIAMQKEKNSYMTKIKFPTSSCTNKFSHNQNHNHTIFQESTSHTQQNFSISQSFIPTKFANTHKYIYAHTHKILPCP